MSEIDKIEFLLLNEFKTVPFHNLFMLNNIQNRQFSLGGTCSDKVLSFKKVLFNNGIKSNLHSSFINGIECHRMLSVIINNKKYFIDVGSGWPSVKLFPEFEEIEYSVYGMNFKTEVKDTEIVLYHKSKSSKEFNKMTVIPKLTKSEGDILIDIKNRFVDSSNYPFQNSIRFSIVKNDKFYFIKGDLLRVYSGEEIKELILNENRILDFIKEKFNFSVKDVNLK
ncbi:arylamine N-acetyltransferase [Lacinutrix chionoecetis]